MLVPRTPVQRLIRPATALASGGLFFCAFAPVAWWFAAPLAVALLSWSVTGVRIRTGFGLALLSGLAFYLPSLEWSGIYVGALPWFALSTMEAVYLGFFGAIVAGLSGRGRRAGTAVSPLIVGVAWVVVEGLRARTPFGGFPWLKMAFGQADGPFAGLAALGGAPLVGFAIAVVGACLALLVQRIVGRAASASERVPLTSVGWPATALVVLTVAGLLVPTATGGVTVPVVGIQGNVPRPGLDFNAERRAVLDNHAAATKQAAADIAAGTIAQPKLVVWPENSSDIDPTRNPDAGAVIREAVDTINAPTLVGTLLDEPVDHVSNVTLLFKPGNGVVGTYVKRHPVPFAEYIPWRSFFRIFSDKVDLVRRDFYPGSTPGIFTVGEGQTQIRAGIAICFEVAYDDLVRDVMTGGANLLVVQTNNATFGFTSESAQQLAISRIRAIEYGTSVIHVSTVGQSALITPDGKAHQVTDLFTQAILSGDLPLRSGITLTQRIGELPEALALLTLIAAVVLASLRGRRGHPSPQVRARVDE